MSERQKAALVVDDDVARHGVELAVALRLKVPHILEGSDRISISLW
jgi:hypothetical protein